MGLGRLDGWLDVEGVPWVEVDFFFLVCSLFFSPDRYTLLWIAADTGFARCVCFGTNARISCFTFGSLMAPQGYEGFVDIDTRVDNDGRFEG